MKKLLLALSALVIAISVFIACNKGAEPASKQTIERNDPTTAYGNFTPFTIAYDENNTRANISFVETPLLFTINLKEIGSKESLELIKKSIKSGTPVEIFVYKDAVYHSRPEIATVKESSPEIIKKLKEETSVEKVPLSKENDIPPMPSEAVMTNIFNLCKNDPDQSFAFKPDGCYARAHKMMAIIAQNGYMCGKQFIYGNLAVNVGGGCCQNWGWHVAPLIRFKNASGVIEVRIFDPSVSSTPLTKAQWFAICTDPCTPGSYIDPNYTFLAKPEVYNRNPSTGVVVYDNNLAKTYCTLNLYKQYSGGCIGVPAGACSW